MPVNYWFKTEILWLICRVHGLIRQNHPSTPYAKKGRGFFVLFLYYAVLLHCREYGEKSILEHIRYGHKSEMDGNGKKKDCGFCTNKPGKMIVERRMSPLHKKRMSQQNCGRKHKMDRKEKKRTFGAD
jgi:hypothetical protein